MRRRRSSGRAARAPGLARVSPSRVSALCHSFALCSAVGYGIGDAFQIQTWHEPLAHEDIELALELEGVGNELDPDPEERQRGDHRGNEGPGLGDALLTRLAQSRSGGDLLDAPELVLQLELKLFGRAAVSAGQFERMVELADGPNRGLRLGTVLFGLAHELFGLLLGGASFGNALVEAGWPAAATRAAPVGIPSLELLLELLASLLASLGRSPDTARHHKASGLAELVLYMEESRSVVGAEPLTSVRTAPWLRRCRPGRLDLRLAVALLIASVQLFLSR